MQEGLGRPVETRKTSFSLLPEATSELEVNEIMVMPLPKRMQLKMMLSGDCVVLGYLESVLGLF